MKKSIIRRIFGKRVGSGQSESDASGQHLELENLEPRQLYSAAPVDAPDEGSSEPQAAEESVVVSREAAAQAALILEGVEMEEDDPDGLLAAEHTVEQAQADTAVTVSQAELGASGPTDVSGQQNVNLVNVDGVSAGLNQATLDAVAEAAKQRWIDSGGLSDDQIATLDNVTYQIDHLDAARLGAVNGNTISVDGDAWGKGWFIDATPLDDGEFSTTLGSGALSAAGGLGGQYDLLTVLIHEQGHILGLTDIYASGSSSGDVMSKAIGSETRLLPAAGQADGAIPGSHEGDGFLNVTFDVTNLLDTGAGSLRQAVSDANGLAGADFIRFTGGGIGTISLSSGQLTITDDVTINSTSEAVVINNTNGNSRVFEVQGDAVTFQDLTISGGFLTSTHGAGLYNNNGQVTLTNVVIDNNQTSGSGADRHGGGIWNNGANATLTGTNVDITNNKADRLSGGNAVGGGLWSTNGSTTNLTDVTFTGNEAREGGGFYISGGFGDTVTLNNATIDSNKALVRGAGFRNSGVDTTVTINGGAISNNFVSNEHGGGFYNNGKVVLTNVDITDNSVNDLDNTNNRFDDSYGGGFYTNASGEHPNAGQVTITGGSITDNIAFGHGGGFWNRGGTVTIDGTSGDPVEIYRNQAGAAGVNGDTDGKGGDTRSGGGFFASDAATTKLNWVNFGNGTDSTDSNTVTSVNQSNADNELRGVGAGFYNSSQSKTWLTDVDLSNHRADQGAAFYQDGIQSEVTGLRVALDDGFARTRGGGFRNATTGGLVDLTDSSIDGNIARNENGGGFYNNGTVNLNNTDVSNGQALDLDNGNRRDSHGGGFYNGGGEVNLTNGSDVLNNIGYGDGAGFRNASGIVNMTGGVVDGNKIIMFSTSTQHGGGFWNSGDAVTNLDSVIISNNETGKDTPLGPILGDDTVSAGTRTRGVGGGFWNTDGSIVNIKGDSQIIGNRSEDGGGFYNTSTGGVVNITGTKANPIEIGTKADPNSARVRGGGFRSTGNTTVNLDWVDVTWNTTDDERGGGFYADGATVTGNNVKINDNRTGIVAGSPVRSGNEQGGGFWVSSNGQTTLTDSEVNSNESLVHGGGIYNDGSRVDLIRTTVDDNFAFNSGGGIFNNNSSQLNLTDSSVSGNIARDHGGGFWLEDDSKVTGLRTNIDGNLTGYDQDGVTQRGGAGIGSDLRGGGFWASGRGIVTLTDSTLNDNEAARYGGGGNLENESQLILNGTTVANNVADNHGGGFRIATNASIDAVNSTISGNYAGFSRAENADVVTASTTNAVGGGFWSQSGGNRVDLNHVTIAENKTSRGGVDAGGGYYRSSGTITIENSILFGNIGDFDLPMASWDATDIRGNGILVGANVIGVQGNGTLTGNTAGRTSADPGLGALADNGGPVLPDGASPGTHTITSGMSADEIAIGSTVAVDQRGMGRASDVGAYELDPLATTLTIDALTIPENAMSGTAFDVATTATSTGTGPLTYAWTVDGVAAGTGIAMDSLTVTNPATDPVQTVDVTVTVTDGTTGQSASETRQVVVVDTLAMPTTGTGSIVVDTAVDEDNGAGSGAGTSLREAIKAANSSAAGTFVITFAGGIDPDLTLTGSDNNANLGDLDITKTNGAVSIVGNGTVGTTGGTTIDGGGSAGTFLDRVFDVRPGSSVFFTNLTITGGFTQVSDDHGAGLRVLGANAIFKDTAIDGNEGRRNNDNVGGGVYMTSSGVRSSRVYMTRGTVSDNLAESHGGGIYLSGTNVGETLLHLTDTVISGNSASDPLGIRTDRDGGGLYITDDGNRVVMNNVTLDNNTTRDDGGGAYFTGADMTIEINGGSITRNFAGSNTTGTVDNDGGGFFVTGARNTVTLTGVTVGGALDTAVGNEGQIIMGNHAEDEGGGFRMEGRFNTVNLVDTLIQGNRANDGGGGFFVANDTETVNISGDSGIIDNFSATEHGGGFRSDGILNITGTATNPIEITGNQARIDGKLLVSNNYDFQRNNGDRVGGGFYTSQNSTTTLTDVRIEDNIAYARGGGFYTSGAATVTISSSTPGTFESTISNNHAIRKNSSNNNLEGDGGGFYNTSSFTTVTLNDVNIDGNTASDEGGGFYQSSNFSKTSLNRVDLTNNTAEDNGGGFYNASNGSIVEMDTVLIDNNTTFTEQGGGFRNNGIVDGKDVTITNNTAVNGGSNITGGGFYNGSGRLTLVDATIDNNEAGGRGGGFFNTGGGIVDISSTDSDTFRSSISDNKVSISSNDGGGFWNDTAGSTVRLNGVEMKNNIAGDDGAGFWTASDNSRVELTDTILDGNTAQDDGGGFSNASAFSVVTLDDVQIINNVSNTQNGGGFRNAGQVTGQDVIVDNNISGQADQTANNNSNRIGGGFFNTGTAAYLNLERVEITNNNSHGRGGGWYSDGSSQVILTDFIVKGNTTDQGTSEGNARGGGFWNSGNADVTLNRGEISENESYGHGAGFYQQDNGSTVTATNVTISGNIAGIDQTGGGFVNNRVGGGFWSQSTGSQVNLNHVTITENETTRDGGDGGSGFRVEGGVTTNLENSIVFGNLRNVDATAVAEDIDNNSGTLLAMTGNNILGVRAGTFTNTVNPIINTDPVLQPLNDNGGVILPSGAAARTHALLTGSVAIDASLASTVTEDQRGLGRTAPNDLGAFEASVTLDADDLSAPIIDNIINLSSDGTNAIVVVDGVTVMDVPLATLDSLTINGQTGDDQLTVDYTTAFDPLPAGGLTWNGDDNVGGAKAYDDHLIIDNGTFTTVTHNLTGPSTGTIDLDGFTAAITYTGLESNAGAGGASAVDTIGSAITDIVFNLPAAAGATELSDLGTDLRFESTGGTFETTDFADPDPTGSVTVNGAAGDTLTIDTAVDMGTASLIVSGGTLTGNGSVSGAVTVDGGGILEPGSVGVGAIATGGLTLDASSDLIVELGGTGASDQVVVTGTVDVTNSSIGLVQASGYTPVLGDTIILIDNDGVGDAVTGTFAGLAEGAFVGMDVGGGVTTLFSISYVGGDGNDVEITALGPVPTTTVTLSGTTLTLTVSDTVPLDNDDNLHISVAGTELVITDPDNILGSVGPGITQPNLNEIRVNTSLFTDLNVMTLGGDDLITIGDLGIGTGTGLQGGITVDGGDGFDNILYTGTDSVLAAGFNVQFDAEEIEFGLGSALTTTDGDITLNGTGGTGSTHQGIHLYGADLTANGAGNTITLNGSGGDTGNSNQGVFLTDGSTVTTTDGNIDIDGVGGGSGVSVAGQGVMIYSDSSLSAGGSGTITINGTGGTGTFQNEGVLFDTGTSASVENGDMTITGTGGGTLGGGFGVSVVGAGLTGTGTGNISINGTSAATGGSNNRGVEFRDSTIDTTAGSGSVAISGSGADAGKDDNMGVSLRDTDITAGGSGTVTLDGTGGSGEKYNHGVRIDGSGSTISSVSGAITIRGTGNGSLGFNRGIQMENATMTTGDVITLTGTGSAAGTRDYNSGIHLSSSHLTAGSLIITGHGGTGSSFNEGVRILEGSLSGMLTLNGTANIGTAGVWNSGVYLLNVDASGLTGGTITGTGGGGLGFNHGIYRSPMPTGLTEIGSTTDGSPISLDLAP